MAKKKATKVTKTKPAARTAKKKAPVKKTPAKKKPGKKVLKTEAIRNYLEEHPKAGPSEIAKHLNRQGIEVTPAYVSTITSTDRKKTGKRRRKARPRTDPAAKAASPARPSPGSPTVSVTDLMEAKKVVAQFGSIAKARAALEAYGKLTDKS